MPTQTEKRIVPYLADHMFSLVADVKSYPEFLPWVSDASVFNVKDNTFDAQLVVGSHPMQQKYTSRVTADPLSRTISAHYIEGPFKHLHNKWTFTPVGLLDDVQTEIEFFIDFEVENILLKPILQPFLTNITTLMIEAFEKRANATYRAS